MGASRSNRSEPDGLSVDFYPGRSFEAVIDDHAVAMMCVARKLSYSLGVEPDDLVQDAWERAWRSRTSFATGAPERPWLLTILYNRARDLARRRTPVPDAPAPEPVVPAPDDGDDDEPIRRALAALPLMERAGLVLHSCAGLSTSEVAAVMGCSTNAVHKRLQRGRLRLARELSRSQSEGLPTPFTDAACYRALHRLPAYLEGVLPDDARKDLEAHVASCPRCPVLAQGVAGLMARLPADQVDRAEGALPGLLARLRAMVAADLDGVGRRRSRL